MENHHLFVNKEIIVRIGDITVEKTLDHPINCGRDKCAFSLSDDIVLMLPRDITCGFGSPDLRVMDPRSSIHIFVPSETLNLLSPSEIRYFGFDFNDADVNSLREELRPIYNKYSASNASRFILKDGIRVVYLKLLEELYDDFEKIVNKNTYQLPILNTEHTQIEQRIFYHFLRILEEEYKKDERSEVISKFTVYHISNDDYEEWKGYVVEAGYEQKDSYLDTIGEYGKWTLIPDNTNKDVFFWG